MHDLTNWRVSNIYALVFGICDVDVIMFHTRSQHEFGLRDRVMAYLHEGPQQPSGSELGLVRIPSKAELLSKHRTLRGGIGSPRWGYPCNGGSRCSRLVRETPLSGLLMELERRPKWCCLGRIMDETVVALHMHRQITKLRTEFADTSGCKKCTLGICNGRLRRDA